mmetsp:Transcript_23071/g.44225  ORF Transcript_23071/g.44225 Transcript_23071/m.44225 type:complete len:80 (-) Transcript_23071:238-477(-)
MAVVIAHCHMNIPQKSLGKQKLMIGIVNQHCFSSTVVVVVSGRVVVVVVAFFSSSMTGSSPSAVFAQSKEGRKTKRNPR